MLSRNSNSTPFSGSPGFVDENGDWALNSDKNVEALNFAIGLVNDGYTNSDPANETRYDLQDMFGAGKVAMMIGPNNIPTYLSDGGYDINYDVTTIPANEGCDSVAMGVCDRLEVFKDDSAEDQEARTAAISKFFDFFYDDERYADYMVFEGFLPTTQTAADLLAKDDDTSHPGSISCRAATSTRQLRPNGQMLNRA